MKKLLNVAITFACLCIAGWSANNTEAQTESMDQEVIDYFFTSQISDGNYGMEKKRWHIKVPKKYVFQALGKNGEDDPRIGFVVSIMFDLHATSGALRQRQKDEKNPDWVSIFLELRSNSAAPKTPGLKKDSCSDPGARNPILFTCSTPNCSINSSFKGWGTLISIRKDLLNEKDKYCEKIIEILNRWTVSIDDARN